VYRGSVAVLRSKPRLSWPVVVIALGCSSGAPRMGTGTSASVGEGSEGSGSGSGGTGGFEATTAAHDGSGELDTGVPDTSGDAPTTSDGGSEGSTGEPPASCAQDVSACDAWFLPRGATAWEPTTVGGPAALAPSSAVLAAFDIEAERVGYVLTLDEVIEIDLEQRRWVSKASFADRFPEITAPVLSAYSIPAYWGARPDSPESVTISGSDVAFLYSYAGGTFSYDVTSAFGDEWSGPLAPVGTDVRAMWLDLTNADGWAADDLSEACPQGSGAVGPYIGVLTSTQAQVLDVGSCFDFFPAEPYAAFTPFGLAGAPPADRVGGAAYNETTGLVIFAGE
jgi:hypothetical protein